ncbi:MAG: AGE family epimerase/isomerase [Propionibacteriaceae bacterium]|nr:AGE family epimerase/isomerase [Propionibacteriaceae bacterium]
MLEAEGERLLAFAEKAKDPRGGFAWLDDAGRPDPGEPRPLWVTARMTHCFALASRRGRPGAADLAAHGVTALAGPFRDARHGGWYEALADDGDPVTRTKSAYPHAFAILAAASATAAGIDGAAALLDQALDISARHFWDDRAAAVVETWSEDWADLDGYRGANANMHTVEAYLAAADVTGDAVWRQRAARAAARFVDGAARANGWRLPEHFTAAWEPLPDYNRDRPDDPFRPYGATVGHALEWSRLVLQLGAALGEVAPEWAVGAAEALFNQAVEDGWDVDGAPGFVYTTDWAGQPVVRQRMHWVAAEAVGAAATLAQVTGDPVAMARYVEWWNYIDRWLIDREHGSWRHELDPANRPAATVWRGKPDIYHAYQATLIPRLPVGPCLAVSVTTLGAA